MIFRPILYRIRKNQYFAAGFCTLENAEQNAHIVSYLVEKVGLSQERAISASKRVNFDSPDKPNAVMNFLEKRGFSKAQILEMVTRIPRILVSDPERTLLPKIEFYLQFTGFPEADVCSFLTKTPRFLTIRLAPRCEYLKDVIGAERAAALLKSGSWVLSLDLESRLIPNVDLLRKLGVPGSSIEMSLCHFSHIYWSKPVEFKKIAEEVKKMGFDPQKSEFIWAMHTRTGKRNLAMWDQCFETYSKWGWSRDDIFMAYRKYPPCMLVSERKISTVLDFVVNKLGRNSRSLAESPVILSYNVENRLIPRCSIAHQLCSNGLIRKNWSLLAVVNRPERQFVERYVVKYADKLPELHDTYLSMMTKAAGS